MPLPNDGNGIAIPHTGLPRAPVLPSNVFGPGLAPDAVPRSILSTASAGQSSAWVRYTPGMRLAYALDTGGTAATFSIDFSADGRTSLGQAFTGSWASSVAFEVTSPLWLVNHTARFIRFNVLSGGPMSVTVNV